METMIGFHGPIGVDEKTRPESTEGGVRNFCCSIYKDQTIFEKRPWEHGGVAQLGEHLPCKQGVMGSNPIISTSRETDTHKGSMMVESEPVSEKTVCSSGG